MRRSLLPPWLLLCTLPAFAQDPAPEWPDDPAPRGQWRASVSTYGWFAGFEGTLKPVRNGPAVSIDESFGEAVENLDAALFATAMARRDRLVLLADLNYTSSSADGGIPTLPGAQADGAFRQTTVLALAGYRVQEDAAQSFDLYGGARYWAVDSRARARAGGQTLVAVEDDFSWLDPVVAARWRHVAGPRGEVLAYADFGGFGAGSERSWQLLALYNHRLGARWTLSSGYRVLSTDYRDGGRIHDVRLHGLLLGLSWHLR